MNLKELARKGAQALSGAGSVTDDFHHLYYDEGPSGRVWDDTYWMGVKVLKCPLDLWVYQEILYEQKPDLIIETGTCHGGSAVYMAHLCDLLGHGEIVTIDIAPKGQPAHPRVRYVTGSSVAEDTLAQVRALVATRPKTLVVLDSDHSQKHVLAELRAYQQFVPVGGYMVVEDTNVNGHPVNLEHGPGPMEALLEFLQEDTRFESDARREKFHLTFNPKGFLRRVR